MEEQIIWEDWQRRVVVVDRERFVPQFWYAYDLSYDRSHAGYWQEYCETADSYVWFETEDEVFAWLEQHPAEKEMI